MTREGLTPWADPLDRDQEAEIDCREKCDAAWLRWLEATKAVHEHEAAIANGRSRDQ